MNDPEVTVSAMASAARLAAHAKALEAAGMTLRLVARVSGPLRPIAEQAIRSAASVPANLDEGHGRTGRDRLYFWRVAFGSAKEVDTHVRLLVHSGAVDATRATVCLQRFDEVRAMTWRLMNPK